MVLSLFLSVSMANHSRSPSQDFCGMRSVCKACKSLVSKRHPEKNSSTKIVEAEDKIKSIDEAYQALNDKKQEEKTMNGVRDFKYNERMNGDHTASPRGFVKHRTIDNYYFKSTHSPYSSPPQLSRSACPSPLSRSPSPSSLSRSTSRRRQTPTRTGPATLLKSMSRRSVDVSSVPCLLSRNASRRGSTPIMYSNSNGLIKPSAVEKQLECTLEELCFGCIKKIKITRDVVTNNGQIVQEEEVLTIKVKPGWTVGTKITFEGMGNEIPGTYPADITFVIAEKRHPLFRREGDDVELAIEIPLVKALTGCTLSIPLVGCGNMSLTIDDVIYPGCEKIIAGQGMPMPEQQGKRGNLILTFLVEFPEELTNKQKSDVYSILQDSC